MQDPVLVEVLRGDHVESVHRGAVAVVDGDGKVVLALGDIGRPVFPRSAVKAMQALPLVESGAADAYGFGDRELALACASHAGEPAHVELAASMLARAGVDGSALECGAHWPLSQDAMVELARSGANPSALHNNCSGKHSGFLCACRHCGMDHKGYVTFGHAYQGIIRDTMQAVTGAAHGEDNAGTDGCSIPTYAVPLSALAAGFARMATGKGLGPERAKAARRLLAACMAEPFYVDGAGRNATAIMRVGEGRVFAKNGAEGVFCAAVPELGLGIAVKCDDGADRAADVVVSRVLADLLAGDEGLSARLEARSHSDLTNRNDMVVGLLRPAGALAEKSS